MLSKRISRYIKSLQLKKYRRQEESFIVEGYKGVAELLSSDFKIELLLYTPEANPTIDISNLDEDIELLEVSSKELEQVGTFKTNGSYLAVAKCKPNKPLELNTGVNLILDDVRDPGNLGTIIRIADWYGVSNILCSPECADLYNPKVINSSMGSFTRVNVWYHDIVDALDAISIPVLGTTLDGESIYTNELPEDALIVLGNESKGVSDKIKEHFTSEINIPRRGGAESLNVAVATAVILDNFFR